LYPLFRGKYNGGAPQLNGPISKKEKEISPYLSRKYYAEDGCQLKKTLKLKSVYYKNSPHKSK
jgi:hypothetical protein